MAAVTVPEVVTQANTAALAALWQQAQELASESLRAAQAAWETERAELDTMRHELADAYEMQAVELDEVKAQATTADQVHQEQTEQAAADLAGQLTAHQEQATALLARLAPTETKAPRAEKVGRWIGRAVVIEMSTKSRSAPQVSVGRRYGEGLIATVFSGVH